MATAISIDGRLVPPGEAKVSVFDRGFLYGDSVYEVLRTYGGAPFELGRHLNRLQESAARIGMELPWSLQRYALEVARTLAATGNSESYVRVVVTRGSGEIGLDPALATAPLSLVIARELTLPPASAYEQGVKVQLVAVRKNLRTAIDPLAKTGNYLNSVLALREAKAAGAFEAILLDSRGAITEGASSNLFVVKKGVLRTPPLAAGILAGVTRACLLEVARSLKIRTEERRLLPAQLLGADEALITSSIRELVPVVRIGGAGRERKIGTGKVGPVTKRLMGAFRERASHGALLVRGTHRV